MPSIHLFCLSGHITNAPPVQAIRSFASTASDTGGFGGTSTPLIHLFCLPRHTSKTHRVLRSLQPMRHPSKGSAPSLQPHLGALEMAPATARETATREMAQPLWCSCSPREIPC